jgi:hypothetical protein
MLSQAYAAIKTIDPSATVVMGGLAYDNFTEYVENGILCAISRMR